MYDFLDILSDYLDSVLLIALLVVIYFVYKKNKVKFSELIKESNDFEESMDLRRQFRKKTMNAILLADCVFAVVYVILDFLLDDSLLLDDWLQWLLIIIVIIVLQSLFVMYFLNKYDGTNALLDLVSTMTPQEFLKENRKYVLYLRSFETDIYDGALQKILPQKIDDAVFSETFRECDLVGPMKAALNLPVCAVGMSKELEQPRDSAIRVYTSDEKWQEDVLSLIKEAQAVYVSISSRDSCLWEIRQLSEYIDKTVFIIDDAEEYQKSRALVGNDKLLPDISDELSMCPHAFLYWRAGKFTVCRLDYSPKGYKRLVDPAIEKLIFRQLDLSGMFKPLNDAIEVSWLDDIESSLQKVCDAVEKELPVRVNHQFMMTGCHLDKSQLSIDYTVDRNILQQINGEQSAFRWLFVDRMSDEASGDLNSCISMCVHRVAINIFDNESDGIHRFVIESDEL